MSDTSSKAAKKAGKLRRASRSSDPSEAGAGIGNALRSVYDQTLEEAVPSEMLDLLGKLD